MYGVQGLVKAGGAFFSVVTIAFLLPMLPDIVKLPSARQVADANERLRREMAAHTETVRESNAMRVDFENRIAELTRGLNLIRNRFEAALRGADIYVFSQDLELRYTWVFSPRGEEGASKMVGRTDDDILASPEHDTSVAAKRRVLKSGVPEECEVTYTMPEGRAVYLIRIFPMVAADGSISGIMCAAINISRLHSLGSEQRLRAEKLETTLQRYDTALRGSNVTVYTQDLGLRYISISSPMLGLDAQQIVGRTDEDILPAKSRAAIITLKKEALDTGRPKDCEVSIQDSVMERWYDLHLEPLREVTGASVGLICASVDVTARKEGEVHLRLLMRELTHRSKKSSGRDPGHGAPDRPAVGIRRKIHRTVRRAPPGPRDLARSPDPGELARCAAVRSRALSARALSRSRGFTNLRRGAERVPQARGRPEHRARLARACHECGQVWRTFRSLRPRFDRLELASGIRS